MVSKHQPLPRWVLAAAFLLAGATGVVAARLLNPPRSPPQTIHELRQRLERSLPSLHVVQVMDATEEGGIYLCTTPQPPAHLRGLQRADCHAERWKGVVLCVREGPEARILPEMLDSWGEHGMPVDDLLFFGDPDLLGRVRTALLDGRHADAQQSLFPAGRWQGFVLLELLLGIAILAVLGPFRSHRG
jgi:hypothetical protein